MKTMSVWRALLMRDFKTAYGKSPMGFVWAVAEPVLGIVLLTLVFSQISSVPPMGSSYPLFYATGYLPFLFFSGVYSRMVMAQRQSKAFFSHGSVTPFDVIVSRTMLHVITMVIVMFVVFWGIRLIYNPQERVDLRGMFFATVMMTLFSVSFGFFNAGLSAFFDSWSKIWGVLSRPLFLISGVFYPYSVMPEHLQNVLWWNPVIHLVGLTRRAVYQGYEGAYISPLYLVIISLVMTVVGLSLLRHQRP